MTGFLVAVALGAVLIGWTERRAWRHTDQLQKRFQAMQQGGFHLADHLDATILRLNHTLFRFDLHENPADRAAFEQESEALKTRLAEHKVNADSQTEREVLKDLTSAYQSYLTKGHEILQESARTAGPGSLPELFEQTEKDSAALFALGRRLAEAQRESIQVARADSEQAFAGLKVLLAASLTLLVVLSLVVAVMVYRGMIAPLRVKLIETRALMERQEKLASLGAMAAGVAHEIRNPLTAIKARLFTQRKLLPIDSEPAEDNLFISEEIARLDGIIKDFLVFARPSEPRFETIKATTPFRELARLLAPELEKKAITLKHEFLADPEIQADPQQIKQVLINLVKNAAESIGQNGSITLRTRTKPGRGGGRAPHVAVLEVEDTGKGIPPEVQKRLFDPFFTTKESGTGLGLSIAARILEKHGGRLEYQTQVGQGTILSIILPFAHNS
ncbi:MAG TPA: ATP-binding protein [Candidatus Paceibacterota bacterium]|nr:ATP-binding protein [Candidatus Paceibacterota bacterium]